MTTKRTRVAGRSIAVGIAGIAALIANACGSDSSSGEEKGCEPQSTRECVGPAACKGGQVCGADGKWGACDCGGGTGGSGSGGTGGTGPGGGGSGGTGGSSASGGTSATGGTGASTSGGTGGATDAGDASADQDAADAFDTGVGPNDDPCPTDPINVNCSTSCGPKTSGCGACDYLPTTSNFVTDQNLANHYVMRTPSNPGLLGGNCAWGCKDAGATPAYYLVAIYKGVQGAFKVTVGKPWKVHVTNDASGLCLTDKYVNGCFKASIGTNLHFWVATDDPSAPARNIVIENLPGSTCTAADYWQ